MNPIDHLIQDLVEELGIPLLSEELFESHWEAIIVDRYMIFRETKTTKMQDVLEVQFPSLLADCILVVEPDLN